MDDVTWTDLVARMNAPLAQPNLSPEAILAQQNVVLAEVTQLLARANQRLEETARESRAAWAAERQAGAELLRELKAWRQGLEEDR